MLPFFSKKPPREYGRRSQYNYSSDRAADTTPCCTSGNGREAVKLFGKHHPDVTLMLIRMPGTYGYDAAAAIRKPSPDVVIIAMTAFAYPEQMRRILAEGFDGCQPKPVNADNLKHKIWNCVRQNDRNSHLRSRSVAPDDDMLR